MIVTHTQRRALVELERALGYSVAMRNTRARLLPVHLRIQRALRHADRVANVSDRELATEDVRIAAAEVRASLDTAKVAGGAS